MKRLWTVLVVLAFPAMALGQEAAGAGSAPYQPAVPAAPVVAGGYVAPVYDSGAHTAAGSAMNGMANVISAAGNYNLSTSAAAINMTQAQRNEIENRQQWTDTYFQMRATNRAAREQERGPKPTSEELVRIAQMGKPKPLTPSSLNPDGQISWPILLTTDVFAMNRAKVDQVFVKRAEHGGMAFQDQMAANSAITAMLEQLKQIIRQVPTADYVAARSFLTSLAYVVQKAG